VTEIAKRWKALSQDEQALWVEQAKSDSGSSSE